MSCENITPEVIEDFIDDEGISRSICSFVNKSAEIKGTISFLVCGYKYERNNTITVVTKGWASKDKPLNPNECVMVEKLTKLGWRILVFNDIQFVTPDGTPLNEIWIEDYAENTTRRIAEIPHTYTIQIVTKSRQNIQAVRTCTLSKTLITHAIF